MIAMTPGSVSHVSRVEPELDIAFRFRAADQPTEARVKVSEVADIVIRLRDFANSLLGFADSRDRLVLHVGDKLANPRPRAGSERD